MPLRPTRIWGVAMTDSARAIKRGLSLTLIEPQPPLRSPRRRVRRHHRAIGLVPDGVIAVRLNEGTVAEVRDNIFSHRVTSRLSPQPVFIWGS